MIRSVLICVALIGAPAAQAQQALAPTGPGSPFDGPPRSVTFWAGVSGYDDLSEDMFGTPTQPVQSARGILMLVRMAHNVCSGLERGAALEDVVPSGYSIYPSLPYSVAENPDPDPTAASVALSPTGSIDVDEAEGNPYIYLIPRPEGLRCSINWFFDGDATTPQHYRMAHDLQSLPSNVFGLVPVFTTLFDPDGNFAGHLDYDRYCDGRWCQFSTRYHLPRGEISLWTILNITQLLRSAQ